MPGRKTETVKIHMSEEILNSGKNLDGAKGPVCNNCGGYGFTMKLKGGKLPCNDCDQTGAVTVSNRELQELVFGLAHDIKMLRNALLKDLKFQSVSVPEAVKEANHVG